MNITAGVDIAGIIYFLANVPLFLLAWRSLGKRFLAYASICTMTSSLLLSTIPVPAVPFIADPLTSCLVGGILSGFGGGLVLTCQKPQLLVM